jgi:hypothetical protein
MRAVVLWNETRENLFVTKFLQNLNMKAYGLAPGNFLFFLPHILSLSLIF